MTCIRVFANVCIVARTTLNLDDAILAAAMEASPGCTKTEVINRALAEYARRATLAELLKLRGKIRWDGNINALRGRERRA